MKYGLIGEHLPHSFSREIHERIGAYSYELCELAPDEVAPFLARRDFGGKGIVDQLIFEVFLFPLHATCSIFPCKNRIFSLL